jgi:Fic family protein
MDRSLFGSRSPGTLVSTQVYQREVVGDVPQNIGVVCDAFVPDQLERAAASVCVCLHEMMEDVLAVNSATTQLHTRLASLPRGGSRLLANLRRLEVQRSSRIEQTIATIPELARAEVDPPAEHGDTSRVLNNLRAISLGLEAKLPFSEAELRESHKVLLRGEPVSLEHGKYRSTQVYIGKVNDVRRSRFVPPPPKEVERLMQELMACINRGGSMMIEGIPWFVWLGMIHYQFEAIHPFQDGNGRLGRMLVTVLPVRWGHFEHPVVNISEYLSQEQVRSEYHDALLAVSTDGDWKRWLLLFLHAATFQAKADLDRVNKLILLRERLYAECKSNNTKTRDIIDLFFSSPFLKPVDIATQMGLSVSAVSSQLKKLAAAGVVEEITQRTTHQIWVCWKVLQTIEVR